MDSAEGQQGLLSFLPEETDGFYFFLECVLLQCHRQGDAEEEADLPVASDRSVWGVLAGCWRGGRGDFLDENRSPGRIPCGGTPAGAEEGEGAAAGAAAGNRTDNLFIPGGREAARRPQEDVKMGSVFGLLWLFTGFLQGVHGQGVYGKDTGTGRSYLEHEPKY